MLAQPRKIGLVPRQAEATKRELLAPRLQACDRPVRHRGPEPVARSAEPRLSCGAWFGLGSVGSPVGNTTGDFILALGLSSPPRLERRFKLQPQLPGQSMPIAVRYSATIADILSLVRPDRISPLRCAVRIVGDEEKAIVDALNALRQRCTYERGARAHDGPQSPHC